MATKRSSVSIFAKLNGLSVTGKALLFALVFATLGGSYYAYHSFAYTSTTLVQTWAAADSELSLKGVSGISYVARTTDSALGTTNKTVWGIVPVWSSGGATKADGSVQKQISIASGTQKTFRLCAHMKASVLPYVQYVDNMYAQKLGWSGYQNPVASNQVLGSSYGYSAICQTKTFSGPVNKLVTFEIEVNNRTRQATNAYLWKLTLERLQ